MRAGEGETAGPEQRQAGGRSGRQGSPLHLARAVPSARAPAARRQSQQEEEEEEQQQAERLTPSARHPHGSVPARGSSCAQVAQAVCCQAALRKEAAALRMPRVTSCGRENWLHQSFFAGARRARGGHGSRSRAARPSASRGGRKRRGGRSAGGGEAEREGWCSDC
ncbi:unnamed protein product [Prorocentrum cordatum]|uniref:Uncharacterized protein n=1 Tax=Prorocentrum cordatum TaxID=2364126 RepID=A0ABN9R5G8_9DINO|nr:unnamed protein product [Polarella glacialis]